MDMVMRRESENHIMIIFFGGVGEKNVDGKKNPGKTSIVYWM
jgi:hypothetical protein